MDEPNSTMSDTGQTLSPSMTVKEKLLYVFGIVLVAVGAVVFTVALGTKFYTAAAEDPVTLGEGIAGTVLIGVFPLVLGFLVCHKMKARKKDRLERLVMMFARQSSGCVTVAEVVTKMSLSFSAAKKLLDDMTTKGITKAQCLESGAMVYKFRDQISI